MSYFGRGYTEPIARGLLEIFIDLDGFAAREGRVSAPQFSTVGVDHAPSGTGKPEVSSNGAAKATAISPQRLSGIGMICKELLVHHEYPI
jgi:hypothetical protein